MGFMDGVMAEIGKTVGTEETQKIFCCQACQKTYKSPEAQKPCPMCNQEAMQWVGDTIGQAMERAKRAASISSPHPSAMVATKPEIVPEPAEEVEVKTEEVKSNKAELEKKAAEFKAKEEIKAELTKRGIKFNGRLGVEKLQTLLDAAEDSQSLEAYEAESRKNWAEIKGEVVEVEMEKEVVEEQPIRSARPTTQSADDVDYKAIREAKIEAYIEKHNIGEFQPVHVGSAKVQLVGFTMWINKKPAYRFMQPFETPESFARVYDEARAEQPSTQIDAVQCSSTSDTDLKECLYNGNLIASLNNGNGTIMARPGSTVEIGAVKTNSGRMRFVVLKVKGE